MILRIEQLKDVCSKLLFAIDNNDVSKLTEVLEIKYIENGLELSITNKEYIVKVTIPIAGVEEFHATVDAEIFLKLISQITTETVELKIEDNSLIVIGNGEYTFPMIYENDDLFELPDIDIETETCKFQVSTDVLGKIMNYNSKEIMKSAISHPVQKMYYIDEKGCITFTSGACITNFNLGVNIKFLLNSKIVKLFRLFSDGQVDCVFGYKTINDEINQPRISFKNKFITLTTILNDDDSMINAVPAEAIRKRAEDTYNYSVIFNKNMLLQTINRLTLFAESNQIIKPYGIFEFGSDSVKIYDKHKVNNETVNYDNHIELEEYTATIDLTDLKSVLDSCKEEHITFNFGNEQAIVIQRPNVYNVIPEMIV